MHAECNPKMRESLKIDFNECVGGEEEGKRVDPAEFLMGKTVCQHQKLTIDNGRISEKSLSL